MEYQNFLNKCGLTDEAVWQMMERLGEPVTTNEISRSFEVKDSAIHGKGVFAKKMLYITDAFHVTTKGSRTILARYVNHASKPNCYIYKWFGEWAMSPLTTIKPGEEILYDYSDNLQKQGWPTGQRD